MAIFSYDNINAKKNDYNDDVIDSMYEMCQDMLDVLGVDESTATQRHYNVTSKTMKKYADGVPSIYDKKSLMGRVGVKQTAENMANKEKLNKALDRGEKFASSLDARRGLGYTLSDSDKAKYREVAKAQLKGAVGASMARAAKSGYNVKKAFDKAHEKEAKKAAVKETCYMILDMLDDMD